MSYLLPLLSAGLVIGACYGLIGMGYAFIYKATGVINFALGEITMVMAYIAATIAGYAGLSFVPLMAVTLPVAALFGLAIERIFVRPMLGEPTFSIVMVTIGLAVVLRGLTDLIWGGEPQTFNPGFSGDLVKIGGLVFYQVQLYAIFCLLFVVAAIWIFFRFSIFGIAMRATANNQRAAMLSGVNAGRVFAAAWAISTMIASLAGVLLASMFTLSGEIWFQGLKAFPAVILGGLDSVLGAALGGIIIGVIENVSEGYIGAGMKEITGFIVIICILMLRPFGLFGVRQIDRV
jgi:branched-chain amino acid transport system permease protein